MSEPDWDDGVYYDEDKCPKCGEYKVCWRDCDDWNCDDGYIDEYEDDPINFAPGEQYVMCRECWGTGIVRWCSGCGFDITAHEYKQRKAKR